MHEYSRAAGTLDQLRVACRDCSLFQLCLPVGMNEADLALLDRIIKRRRPVRRGEHLFRIGEPFAAVYAVRSGSIKTFTLTDGGRELVTGFHLPGELLGLEGIGAGRHACSAKALESASVCELPFDRFEALCDQVPNLLRQMLRIMSKKLYQEQTQLAQLGQKDGEARLAAFLISLSNRFRQRGFSAREFNLSMSRADIGSYLGLAKETVSRLFGRFQEEGLIAVSRKHVRLLNVARLEQIASGPAGIPPVQAPGGAAVG